MAKKGNRKEKSAVESLRLKRRWVMTLCNKLMSDEGLSRSNAMRQALDTWWVLEAMGSGIVGFSYLKENGWLRMASGTLCKGICPDFDNYVRHGRLRRDNNAGADGTFVYWDVTENGFRSFKAGRLKNIFYHRLKIKD